jgi:hypothetical protein
VRLATSVVIGTFAGHAAALECNLIGEDKLRLACYDKAHGKVFLSPTPKAEESSKMPTKWESFNKNLKLADESTPKGIGSDPATISLARRDGEEYSAIKAALIWEPSESIFPVNSWMGRNGWGPGAALSINRNSLAAKRTDSREVAIGLSGIAFEIDERSSSNARGSLRLGMVTKLSAGYRENRVEGTHSNLYKVENVFSSDYFRWGIQNDTDWAWYFIPRLGLFHEDIRRAKAGSPTGSYSSIYGIAKLEVYPTTLSNRLKLTMTAQRFQDLSASGGLSRRRETFAKAGIEYLLYSPTSTESVMPSLALERTTGADPLNGASKFGQTQLVFKVKIN